MASRRSAPSGHVTTIGTTHRGSLFTWPQRSLFYLPFPSGRVSGGAGPAFGVAADPRLRPGDVFRDCESCPEIVVLPGGGLALGRYEVTVGEYRAFASATGAGAGDCFGGGYSWRDPGFPQTDRHPVTCVSWDDAQAYVSWLSRTTGVVGSSADGGGMGAWGIGFSARLLPGSDGERWNVPCRHLRCERVGSVGHGRERD